MATCRKCGHEHIHSSGRPSCSGHKRYAAPGVELPEGPRPCKNRPLAGQDVCRSHGGGSPQAKAAAARRIQEEQARRVMVTYGERVEVDPGEEMLDLICWTAGHVRWLRARVQELEETTATIRVEDDDAEDGHRQQARAKHSLVWGVTKDKIGGDDSGTTYEAKPNIYLALYNSETDRLAKLCADAIKIGLKEREVRLAERQGEAMMRVLDGVLAELGHNPADPAVAGTVERHLRAVG